MIQGIQPEPGCSSTSNTMYCASLNCFLSLYCLSLCCRPGSKGQMQRYLPAQLRVAKAELQRALQQHSSCPVFVPKWLRGDSINSAMLLA